MQRTKDMNEAIDGMTKKLFGRSIYDATCVFCGSDKIQPTDFRDSISWKEFGISHMCQICQDKIFTRTEA